MSNCNIDKIKTFPGWFMYLKTRIMIKLLDLFKTRVSRLHLGYGKDCFILKVLQKVFNSYLLVVKLDITDKCNLKCKMCYAHNKEQEMDIDLAKSIIKQIGRVSLRLEFLGGEPLFYSGLFELIRFAKSKTMIKNIVLYTNGTLVTQKIALALKDAGLDKAIVTFTSHHPEKHDYFVDSPGAWKRTLEGIENLKNAGIKTCTFTTIHSENYNDLSDIYEFVSSQLKVTPLFCEYIPQSKNDPLVLSAIVRSKIKQEILCKFSKKHSKSMESFIALSGRLCPGGHYVISIKSDGSVTPCPFIHDIILGDLKKDSIWDIFAYTFKNKDFFYFNRLPKECRICSYKDICAGGCRAGNKVLGNNYTMPDYRCLGPWSEPICQEDIFDRLPHFF
jgi:AdoMet-dependent heme synthase